MTWFLISFLVSQNILLIVIILSLTLLIFLMFHKRRPKLYPPGPFSLPIIGNLHNLGARPHETFMHMKESYGDIIAIDFANEPAIVLNSPKVIREAFNKIEFSGRANLYPLQVRCGGDKLRGVISSDGQAWQEQRRFLMKTLRDFGFGRMSMESLIQIEISDLIQSLSKLNGNSFRTQNLFNIAVVNSLWSIITGQRFSQDDRKLLELVKYITEAFADAGLGAAFLFFPWLCKYFPVMSGYQKFMAHQFKTMELIKEQVREHKITFQNEHLRDVLDVNLQEILNSSDSNSSFYQNEGEKNLVASLMDLFYAGLETTSTTLFWIILYLSVHPNIQDKLFKEITEVVGLSRLPSLTDRPEMPYTEAIIIEVLRISSLVPLSIFHRATKDVSFYNYVIPKDTLILANLYGVHRDSEIWGDPETFRPERFIDENGKIIRKREAFLPFSSGKRICLGESLARDELFLFVTSIFQRFSIQPDPTKPKPTTVATSGFVLSPKPYDYVLSDR